MKNKNITIKNAYRALSYVFIVFMAIDFSREASAHIKPIKSLTKKEVIQYFQIVNQDNNQDLNFTYPKDISIMNFEENEDGQVIFSTEGGEYFQLYKIALDNTERLFYVMTYKYIGNFYTGYSSIWTVQEITANNKLKIADNYDLDDDATGYYTHIEGFAHCEDKVCVHFSIKPHARWNANMECLNPFKVVNDWVFWQGDALNVYERKINRIVCLGGQLVLTEADLIEEIAQQIQQGSLTFSNIDETVDGSLLITLLTKKHPKTAIQEFTLNDFSLSSSEFAELSKWLSSQQNLQKLDLSFNQLNSTKEFAYIIQQNPNLTTIDFSGNTFKGSAVKKLAKAISGAKKLKTVILSDCLYDAESLKLIVDAISKNKNIEKVDFSTTAIDIKEFEAVKQLAENTRINLVLDFTS
jgi:hypothetical protein